MGNFPLFYDRPIPAPRWINGFNGYLCGMLIILFLFKAPRCHLKWDPEILNCEELKKLILKVWQRGDRMIG